jgi:hypothetical protein
MAALLVGCPHGPARDAVRQRPRRVDASLPFRELGCRNRNGREHVAARHVVTFDVGADDSVVYGNGYGLFRLMDGDWQPVPSANLVENACL